MSRTIASLCLGLLVTLGESAPARGQGPTPSKTQAGTTRTKGATAPAKAEPKININTATLDELQELPGIGPARASEIVKARPFRTLDELKAVKGISAKVYDDLAPRLTVAEPAARKSVAKDATTRKPAAKEAMAKNPATKKAAATEASKEDDAAHLARKKSALPPGKRININSASAEDLQLLPGVGPVRAAAIIAHRPFNSIEDIMKVEGIKEGIFGHLKDHISVK
jgi:competence protein ComEA